jgi:hypothetical protein
MLGRRLVEFHRAHGVLPSAPRLTSSPQPPFTAEYSTQSSSLRHTQAWRRLRLIGYALIGGAGFWIAAQFLDLIAASVRP